jgi:hypothetical protein
LSVDMNQHKKPSERNEGEATAAELGIYKVIAEDWTRWMFQSSEGPNEWHLVDLSEWEGSGSCSCQHFQCRIHPLLSVRAIRPHSDQAKCKHIRRAEKVLLHRVKKTLFQTQNPNQKRR